MLEQEFSHRTVRKVTGIALGSSVALKRNNVIPREQIDAVKKHLQDRFALIASQALEAIDPEKLHAAGFGELVRGAAVAANQAGITAPSVAEIYSLSIQKYLVVQPRSSGRTEPQHETPSEPESVQPEVP